MTGGSKPDCDGSGLLMGLLSAWSEWTVILKEYNLRHHKSTKHVRIYAK